VNSLLQLFDPANIGAFFTQLQADMLKPAFWLAVGKIIWINVLLSGDNALVIAMACRGLHPRQRVWGMVIGAGIAKLLVPDDGGDDVTAGTSLWHAVRIVVIADIVMSLDNVIAVAAAANGQLSLLILGLAISIPMIIAGAALIMMVLDRFPLLVWLGATLLGWIAGDVIETDPAIHPLLQRLLDGQIALNLDATSAVFNVSPHFSLDADLVEYICSVLGAITVLVVGAAWRKSKQHQEEQLVLTPAREAVQPGDQT
jgi:predicted tellurium resistance membrane protein TerC